MTTPYIGSKISLISRLDIRYEGILYSVDPVDANISLSQVRSFGTEDRPAAVHVPARQDIFEFIIFKANDIKDLIVCETSKPTVDDIEFDPAIISVSKPPPSLVQQQQQQTQRQNVTDERDSSAHEYSQASSPQPEKQQQQQPQQKFVVNEQIQQPIEMAQQNAPPANKRHNYVPNNNNGGFGQSVQRAYYNRAMQQPQQQQQPSQQQYNYPPFRTYHAQQYRQQPTYEQGRNRRDEQQNRQAYHHHQQQQHWPHYNYYHQQQQQKPMPTGVPRFDGDYDFEKANEQFRDDVDQVVEELSNAQLQDKIICESIGRTSEERKREEVSDVEGADKSKADDKSFYDKNLSFFDDISCEALERETGNNNRVAWKKERVTNQETFGQSAVRMHNNYRRRGRGGGGGGHPQNRAYYGHQQNYYPRYNYEGGGAGGRQQ